MPFGHLESERQAVADDVPYEHVHFGADPAVRVVCRPGIMRARSREKTAVSQMFQLNMYTRNDSWKPERGMDWFLVWSCAGLSPALGVS